MLSVSFPFDERIPKHEAEENAYKKQYFFPLTQQNLKKNKLNRRKSIIRIKKTFL